MEEKKQVITNREKQNNYRTQFQRLKKAMDNAFYLEAVFIEYAIMEDRTESILAYQGYKVKARNKDGFISFSAKQKKIVEINREKKSLMHRYFSDELMNNLMDWVNERNPMVHALLKRKITTAELKAFAMQGEELCKDLRNRANNYKRMVERRSAAGKL